MEDRARARAQSLSCLRLCNWGRQPARLLCPWDSPGKTTGLGCHFLLQGIFPDPRIKPASPALAGGFFTIRATKEALSFSRISSSFRVQSPLALQPMSDWKERRAEFICDTRDCGDELVSPNHSTSLYTQSPGTWGLKDTGSKY